jgi:hypothetical protein
MALALILKILHFVWIQMYFWDIVNSEGLLVDLQKTIAIITMPTPTNVTKIKRFLVAIEFYWHYFQDFASKATLMSNFEGWKFQLNKCFTKSPWGTLVKKSRKYMSKNIGCNILVVG